MWKSYTEGFFYGKYFNQMKGEYFFIAKMKTWRWRRRWASLGMEQCVEISKNLILHIFFANVSETDRKTQGVWFSHFQKNANALSELWELENYNPSQNSTAQRLILRMTFEPKQL